MKVVREQTEILLMEYAAGTLAEAESLLVASYITLCPEARRYVSHCEMLGGQIMTQGCRPVEMAETSLQAVLDRIDTDDTPAATDPQTEVSAFCREQPLPRPLSGYIHDHCAKARWKNFTKGMQYCSLSPKDGSHAATLIRLAPGIKAARHTHNGTELTLVLEGGFEDEYGHYEAGDLIVADETITHQPVAGNKGCLCIAVTDAPLRFTGSLYRLLNLFIR